MVSFLDKLGEGFESKQVARINDGIDPDILEKNPLFENLLQEFIEFLHVKGNPLEVLNNINDNLSVRDCDDVSLTSLYEQYAPFFPQSIRADRRLFLRLMTDFYTIKGSIESVRLFFKVVFNEEVNITYPSDYVFTTSDNEWNPELYGGLGGWLNTKGFTSYDQVLADAEYYQPYSYVIETGINIEQWKYPYTRCVHNAGYAFFGRIVVDINTSLYREDSGALGLIEDENEPIIIDSIAMGTFDVENNLLFTLPETIYNKISHAYQPDKAILDNNGNVVYIQNDVNKAYKLIQPVSNLRPRLNGKMMNFSKSSSENIHMFFSNNDTTATDVNDIVEIHMVATYKDGVDSSFDSFDTLFSSSGTNDAPRISGGIDNENILPTSSFHATGLVRKDNGSESLALLPLRKNVVSTVMGTFSNPTSSSNVKREIGGIFTGRQDGIWWVRAHSATPYPDSSSFIIHNNRLVATVPYASWRLAKILTGDDYEIEANITHTGVATGSDLFVYGRGSNTVQQWIGVTYRHTENAWLIGRFQNNVWGQFSGWYSDPSFKTGGTRNIKLRFSGNMVQLLVDNVIRIQVANTIIPTGQSVGVALSGSVGHTTTSGYHIDDIKVRPITYNYVLTKFEDDMVDNNDVLIVNHNRGYNWVAQAGISTITSHARFINNRLYSTATNNVYRLNYTLPSADYEVEGIFYVVSNIAGAGITGRASSTANTHYSLTYNGSAWRLGVTINGTFTQLASFNMVHTVGQTVTAILRMQGSIITGVVNGVAIMTVSNTQITAIGSAGVRYVEIMSPTTGLHLQDFTVREANPNRLSFQPFSDEFNNTNGTLLKYHTSDRSWIGDIGYILTFKEALTEDERKIVTKYLQRYMDYSNIEINQEVGLEMVSLRGEQYLTYTDMYFRPGDIREYIGYDVDEILVNWDNQPSMDYESNPTTETILRDLDDII